jgi:DNA-binding SARP family transcriptional activator/pimeloyl-ACP methyl ester carboxylesterase
MRYRLLGTLEVTGDDGRPVRLTSALRRLLLAVLIVEAGRPVAAWRLVDLLWGQRPDPPDDPARALHSHVHRLRGALAQAGAPGPIETTAAGYVLRAEPEQIDARRFERLAIAARKARPEDPARSLALADEALALWRGPALGEFQDSEFARHEGARLRELRLALLEDRVELLLAIRRPDAAVTEAEALCWEAPHRERACAFSMTALYRAGRQVEALARYRAYRRHLAEEFGLEPSPALQRLEHEILQHADRQAEEPAPSASAVFALGGARSARFRFHVQVEHLELPDGSRLAFASAGDGGTPLVVVPAWVSSIRTIAAGRDPRSGLLAGLAARRAVVCYDRVGTGLSARRLADPGLDAAAGELESLLVHLGVAPVPLLAVSQAGPVAVTVAARRRDLVSALVLLGTYAAGPATFPRRDVTDAMVALVKAHWGIASRTLADLFQPGATGAQADGLAADQRSAASAPVAAMLLAAMYLADVTDLLPQVRAPALVLHYLDDRAVPFCGAEQLAAGLPRARLVPLDGRGHLPLPDDLDAVVAQIERFLTQHEGAVAGF